MRTGTGWTIAGITALVIGLGTAVSGAAVMAIFGTDGAVSTGIHEVSTPTSALVVELDDFQGTDDFATFVGKQRIQVEATSQHGEAFLGIGKAEDVDRYLASASRERVTDIDTDPFELTSTVTTGGRPAPPASVDIWQATATGQHATLDWAARDGDYRLVLMNSDASPQFTADVRGTVTLSHMFGLGLGLLIGGVVVIFLGAGLLVVASASRRSSRLEVAR